MSDPSQEHPALSLIRKYVDEGAYDPTAQQGAPQPQAPQDASPQGQQALDFAGQQGDMGEQQAQEAPQEQQPAPMQHPQMTQLSPGAITQNYHQDVDQAQQQYNQGVGQQVQAEGEKTAGNMANNDAAAAALPQFAEIDRQYAAARQGIDEHVANSAQQSVVAMQGDISKQEQLLNENPHNWWGNAGTVNKIGAVIGMIGAGLHGDNASEYFNKIVNHSVAENERKQGLLQQIGRSRDRLANAQDKIADNQAANLEARKAAGYGFIKNQLAQRLAMTKNPQEMANYHAAIGKLTQQAAEYTMKGADNIHAKDLGALHTQLEIQKMNMEQMTAQQSQGTEQTKRGDDITKTAMGALKGNPELNRIDTRIAQLEPAIHVLRNNPDATSPQIQQILLQVLNGEIGGRVPTEMLEHMTPNSYIQKWQEQRAKLTNNPQDAHAKAFLDKTADIAEQTLTEIKKQKFAKRHELLRPLEDRMDPTLRKNIGYDEQANDTPAKEPTDAERARAIMDKYK